jgi:ANTAR domain
MIQKTTSRRGVVRPAHGRPRSALDIRSAVSGMARSCEPAVVLSSLARASCPSFSDACAVELSEGADALFRVSFPRPDGVVLAAGLGTVPSRTGASAVTGNTITTGFQAAAGHGHPSFAGMVVHSWIDRGFSEDDAIIARLLVDRALAIVLHERLARSAARADDRAAKLAIDLITSRIEGEAIGILMAKQQVTEDEAVGLLRRVSWTHQRSMHEAAADVVRTQDLRRLLERGAAGPAQHEHLRVAAPHQPAAKTVRSGQPSRRLKASHPRPLNPAVALSLPENRQTGKLLR